jgi:dTDP-4-amino-4,6-dideoxygalactose transaminase
MNHNVPMQKITTPNSPIHFIDLEAQQAKIRAQVDQAIKKVLDHGIYIMGPEIAEFEKNLGNFCGAKHNLSCSNGTDALAFGLMAFDTAPGDAIFVPSFTFAATAEVVTWFGATPIFIDVLEDTFNMDPHSLEKGIALAKKLSLKATGIIPVDLFGLPADYDAIESIAKTHSLWIMADAAQSFGASYKGRQVGTLGDIATTSFFPAKPLGCYGDGGAVFTNNDEYATVMRSIRVHGQGSDKYDNVRIGMNGRLDTLQAAILLQKLAIFPEEIKARNQIAQRYQNELQDIVKTPFIPQGLTSVWAQYTVQLPENIDRKSLMIALQEAKIPSVVYYVKPLHLQNAYKHYPCVDGYLPISEKLAQCVLSLPMHPYLEESTQDYIIENFRDLVIKA